MKISVTKDFRTFKAGEVIDLSDINKLKYLTMVGNNGSGKSSLIQTIRGTMHSDEGTSLFSRDYKELAKNVSIESSYEKVFVYDSIKDDGNHFMNAYDASNYLTSGGFGVKDKSHGESSVYNLHHFHQRITKQIVKDKTLIILDEIDKGLSLHQQANVINFVYKLHNEGCHVIFITHNVFAIKKSIVVYDLEKRAVVSADKYIKEITGYSIKRAEE